MKVVIEKTEALSVMFQKSKEYLVLKEFNNSDILGTAKVFLEGGIMYANIEFIQNAKGYPAVGYTTNGKFKFKKLFAIGISETRNQDESIEPIEYALQLEGKPSNLKTK